MFGSKQNNTGGNTLQVQGYSYCENLKKNKGLNTVCSKMLLFNNKIRTAGLRE